VSEHSTQQYTDPGGGNSQVNPNKTPQPEQSIRVGELASLLVHQCQVYMDRTTWPDSDVEIERLARHLAVNLLADHEVIPKRICPRIRKPRQKRRNP